MAARSLDELLTTQKRLIKLEREAEAEEVRRLRSELSEAERARRGLCLRQLRVLEEEAGLGGRTLIRLYIAGGLPAHRFQAGNLVELFAADRPGEPVRGVLYRVGGDQLWVALSDEDELPAQKGLRLERGADDVTWHRIAHGLQRIAKIEEPGARRLREVLLGSAQPEFQDADPATMQNAALDHSLDQSQLDAVDLALRARDLALIHGPPGTGKTTALVELIRRAVAKGEKVLACAPSNIAVDNLVERLLRHQVSVVRVGHPARLHPEVLHHSLDAWVARSEAKDFAAQARRELDDTRRILARTRDRAKRHTLKAHLTSLRQEIRRHEASAIDEALSSCQVVATTCLGAADSALRERRFDLVVVDEAAQALEAACWLPAQAGRRLVLAGDHHQLGPVVRSQEAQREQLGRSLFEQVAEQHPTAVHLLQVQYRMHESIMSFSSQQLYSGQIQAHPSVATHRLCDLPGVVDNEATRHPLRFVDTAGCDLEESQESAGSSRRNEGEARLVSLHVRALIEAGLPAKNIAVITPYNAQVETLRTVLYDLGGALEIGSVDGLQGREKEAVVISMVRSNPQGEIGFLREDRRNNVAFTRARRQLSVIGDSATLGGHAFLANFLAYCEQAGSYETAWSFL